MKPGRELDALVAEKVMGATWDEARCRVCGWPMNPDDAGGCQPSNCSMRPVPAHRADTPPPYSTDISAAWLVWKKAPALSPHKVMTFWVALRCLVALRINYDYRISDAMATFHMEPEDICKAMLEACGMQMLPDWYYEP